MKPDASMPRKGRSLLHKIHADEEGAVSIETVLILAAISLPVLIFLVKFVLPSIKQYMLDRTNELLEEGVEPAAVE